MSMEEIDAVLYYVKCENHKQQENSRVQGEMSKFKG